LVAKCVLILRDQMHPAANRLHAIHLHFDNRNNYT